MKLKHLLTGTAIFTGLTFAQVKEVPDSTLQHTLDEITVLADKEDDSKEDIQVQARRVSLFYGDSDKKVMIVPGVISDVIGNITSEYSVDGVPYNETSYYLDNVKLLGSKSQWQGTKPIFSSDMTEHNIFSSGYSTKFSDVGGFQQIDIAEYMKNWNSKGDASLVDREVSFRTPPFSFVGTELALSGYYQDLDIMPVLENNFKELKLLPRGWKTHVHLDDKIGDWNIRFFGMHAKQYQNFEDKDGNLDVKKITHDQIHSFGKFDVIYENEDVKTTVTVAREYENLESAYTYFEEESYIMNSFGNTTAVAEVNVKPIGTSIGATSYFFRAVNDKQTIEKDVYRIYVDNEFILGSFWMKPSVSYLKNGDEDMISYGMTSNFVLKDFEIEMSAHHRGSFLDNYSARPGKGIWRKKHSEPSVGDHYNLAFKFDGLWIFDRAEVSGFYKEIETEFRNYGYAKIISRGIRALAEIDELHLYFIAFVSNPKISGGLIPGVVEHNFQYLYWVDLWKGMTVNTQLDYRSGRVTTDKSTGEAYRLKDGFSLNIGMTQNISVKNFNFYMSLSGFNLLKWTGTSTGMGSSVDESGDRVDYDGPMWGDIRLGFSGKF